MECRSSFLLTATVQNIKMMVKLLHRGNKEARKAIQRVANFSNLTEGLLFWPLLSMALRFLLPKRPKYLILQTYQAIHEAKICGWTQRHQGSLFYSCYHQHNLSIERKLYHPISFKQLSFSLKFVINFLYILLHFCKRSSQRTLNIQNHKPDLKYPYPKSNADFGIEIKSVL